MTPEDSEGLKDTNVFLTDIIRISLLVIFIRVILTKKQCFSALG